MWALVRFSPNVQDNFYVLDIDLFDEDENLCVYMRALQFEGRGIDNKSESSEPLFPQPLEKPNQVTKMKEKNMSNASRSHSKELIHSPEKTEATDELLYFTESWLKAEQDKNISSHTGNLKAKIICFLSSPSHQQQFQTQCATNGIDSEQLIWVSSLNPPSEKMANHFYINPDSSVEFDEVMQNILQEYPDISAILYLWPTESSHFIQDHQPIVYLVQAMIKHKLTCSMLMLAGFYKDELEKCWLESWTGYVRSLKIVLSNTVVKLVLEPLPQQSNEPKVDGYFNHIVNELFDNRQPVISYQESGRFALNLKQMQLSLNNAEPKDLIQGTILITGGLGGLGYLFAQYLIGRDKVTNLILMGRSSLDERRQKQLDELNKGNCHVDYMQADVSDVNSMRQALHKLNVAPETIIGVIHAAGQNSEVLIQDKKYQDFQKIISPKVMGTLALDQLFRDTPLKFVCYFSSSSAILGDFGSCDYAIGNRFQMNYAHYRNQLVKEEKLSGQTYAICWPVWRSGGMTSDSEANQLYLQSSGQQMLEDDEGTEIFSTIVAQAVEQVLVMKGQAKSILRFLGVQKNQKTQKSTQSLLAVLKKHQLTGLTTQRRIEQELKLITSELLKIAPDKLERDVNLAEFGFDSISLMSFARALSDHYGIEITPAIFFSHTTFEQLTSYFLTEHLTTLEALYQTQTQVKPTAPPLQNTARVPALPTKRTKNWRRLGKQSSQGHEPIAIVGMSGLFPQANSIAEFWDILEQGQCVITEVPSSRFDWRAFYGDPKIQAAKTDSKWGGFIPSADEFDAFFFEISPKEAEVMDPRQRLILQESWKALESAGFVSDKLKDNKIGMFVGVEGEAPMFSSDANVTSVHNAVLASRLSYFLNLNGPVMALNTACSSGLVAAHQAILNLQNEDCDAAVVAGVNLVLSPLMHIALSQAGMLSPDGTSYAFDKRANGLVIGEAVVALVFKKLSKAEEDGDIIHAVIRGSGVNYDGRTNNIMAPSGKSQRDLIRGIYDKYQVNSNEIAFILGHGTSTRLGDSVELNALDEVFKDKKESNASCVIGSLKNNIGHTFAASGLVNLVAMVEALKHNLIPSTVHCQQLTDYVSWEKSHFHIANENVPWTDTGNKKRLGAISAFGINGTNAHMVVESYSDVIKHVGLNISLNLIPISAKSIQSVIQKAVELQVILKEQVLEQKLTLESISYTLQAGRIHYDYRVAFIVKDIGEIIYLLEKFINGEKHPHIFQGERKKDIYENMAIKNYFNDVASKEITADDIEAIADLYCQGYTIDWGIIWKNDCPSKIQLPTYPFANEHYPMNSSGNAMLINIYSELDEKNKIKSKAKLKTKSNLREGRAEYRLKFSKDVDGSSGESINLDNKEKIKLLLIDSVESILGSHLVDDDFDKFYADIGLTSLGMMKLAARIKQQVDSSFQPDAFFEYNTLSSLSEHLVQTYFKEINSIVVTKSKATALLLPLSSDNTFEYKKSASEPAGPKKTMLNLAPELIRLNEVKEGRPIFWFHPGTGSVQPYYNIAIQLNRPFFAIEPKGWSTAAKPLFGTNQLAEYYCDILEKIHSQAPFDLGGYSFGGSLAYEVTRLLQERNNSVSSIVMVDSYVINSKYKLSRLKEKKSLFFNISIALLATEMSFEDVINNYLPKLSKTEFSETKKQSDIIAIISSAMIKAGSKKGTPQLEKELQHKAIICYKFNMSNFIVKPLVDNAVQCIYLKNKNGLFYQESLNSTVGNELVGIQSVNDYWLPFKENLLNFELIDINASSHLDMLIEPESIESIINILKKIYDEK
tara:strand:- start:18748 stop:24108 length:5361 start_codon:yes stop_codon:yes gene_type:complete